MAARDEVKEPTATVFVFARSEGGGPWQVALVAHPRLGAWLPPGGHVEAWETAADAALREVGEETGIAARLLAAPAPVPLPAGFPHRLVAAPWWIVEMPAAADGHTPHAHVHVDHVFVALAASRTPLQAPAHPVGWYDAEQVARLPGVAEDSRLQAVQLFAQLWSTRVDGHGVREPDDGSDS